MSPTRRRSDVLIVGAGVIGSALARELAGRGRRVLLLERGRAGQEASAAAAGMLNPQSDCRVASPFFELALESRALYPDWSRQLEEETGLPVGYRRTGLLRCALTEEEEGDLEGFLWQRERGLAVESWDRREVARRVAGLSQDVRSAVFFPGEAVVDPRRLTSALIAGARRRGVELAEGVAARRFWIEGSRCRGVETEGGERLEADAVVNAAGAWAAFDRELALPVPVEPVRGQIVELDLGSQAPATVLHSEAIYLVPHGDGRLLIGSTLERTGFRKDVTAGAVESLIASAARLWPAVRAAVFVTAWAGLRPATPDGLPLFGACGVAGLFFATGHYRNGILLAPITARLLADRLAGTGGPEPFPASRFAQASTG